LTHKGPQSPPISILLSNLYTGLKLSSAKTIKFFRSHTKSSPPLNLHIHIILSLFSPTAALVLQMSSVTLSRPPSSSSLKVNNHFFRHASPCFWN